MAKAKYQLLGPLKPEEYETLKQDIERRGVLVPIEVDEAGNPLDGHHRIKIAEELGLKYKTITRRFKTEAEKKEHVLKLNMARRHMTPYEWAEAFEQLLKLREVRTERGPKPKGSNSATVAEIATELGVPERTARHRLALAADFNALPEKEKDAVRAGEKTVKGAKRDVDHEKRRANTPCLPEGKFRVVYADPPWPYTQAIDKYGPALRHYPLMSIKELCEMPIVDRVADEAVLFLWVTSPFLFESASVIQSWGFTYKASFVWDKVKHNYGHYNSVRHEFLLVCTRGSCTPDKSKLYDSVQTIERTEKHSEKPKEFRAIIEDLYPGDETSRMELFGRKKVKGWAVYGNEL